MFPIPAPWVGQTIEWALEQSGSRRLIAVVRGDEVLLNPVMSERVLLNDQFVFSAFDQELGMQLDGRVLGSAHISHLLSQNSVIAALGATCPTLDAGGIASSVAQTVEPNAARYPRSAGKMGNSWTEPPHMNTPRDRCLLDDQ